MNHLPNLITSICSLCVLKLGDVFMMCTWCLSDRACAVILTHPRLHLHVFVFCICMRLFSGACRLLSATVPRCPGMNRGVFPTAFPGQAPDPPSADQAKGLKKDERMNGLGSVRFSCSSSSKAPAMSCYYRNDRDSALTSTCASIPVLIDSRMV